MKVNVSTLGVCGALCMASIFCVVMATPLDDYVTRADNHYRYEPLKIIHKENYTIHILNMTSQKWMDENYSNHPIWWHYVFVIVPKKIKVKDTAFLLVARGHNSDKIVDIDEIQQDLVILIAVSTQTVGVVVMQVPNEPIVFWNDPSHRRRTEDHLLAWSWRSYLRNPNQPDAIVMLPMTKAVVRAMDTVEDYTQKILGHRVNKFFVTGASKRGWVAWGITAVDKRVIGAAPLVYDLLNMTTSLHHHYRSLGGWSIALEAYYEANVTTYLHTRNFQRLANIIDPLVYKDRYKVPLYIIRATGDEFFLLDETKFFYNQLPGPRYLKIFQNCDHFMINKLPEAMFSLRSFYLHLLHGATYPKVTWTMTSSRTSGTIRVVMDRQPLTVTARYAQTLADGRRDFRLVVKDPKNKGYKFHSVFWSKGEVTKINPMEYVATAKRPLVGWRAFLVEVTFKGMNDSVLEFTTEVNIVPDTLPFLDCKGTNCTGILV